MYEYNGQEERGNGTMFTTRNKVWWGLGSLCLVLTVGFVLVGGWANGSDGGEQEVSFGEVSVHDPSVVKDGETYYIFGSHLASAKSDDLMHWEQVSTQVSDDNPLIPNVYEELAEAFEWAETDTLWAADVIQLEDGNYYMYYNACKGDSPRSVMGVAVADDIEGPYRDLGIFLKSGMWGEESEDGTIYDAQIHPNVVDPHVFFDKDGLLWMVYGSYSGGIFIMEMNPQTGKPFPGQGYGKHLMGGNHSRIEALIFCTAQRPNTIICTLRLVVSMPWAVTICVWRAQNLQKDLTLMRKAMRWNR